MQSLLHLAEKSAEAYFFHCLPLFLLFLAYVAWKMYVWRNVIIFPVKTLCRVFRISRGLAQEIEYDFAEKFKDL